MHVEIQQWMNTYGKILRGIPKMFFFFFGGGGQISQKVDGFSQNNSQSF